MKDSITVYSSPTCPKCKMLKLTLQKEGIEYEENQDLEVMKSLGITSVPVLSVNGQLFGMQDAIKWIRGRK